MELPMIEIHTPERSRPIFIMDVSCEKFFLLGRKDSRKWAGKIFFKLYYL